jgi:hypothetical protein
VRRHVRAEVVERGGGLIADFVDELVAVVPGKIR